MSIVTKKGDSGKTRLYSGEEVSKSDPRLETYGTIDELISFIGLSRSFSKDVVVNADLLNIQKNLFRLGTELAIKGKNSDIKYSPINSKDVEDIENTILDYEESIQMPNKFIIPGDTQSSSIIHVTRSICRRFERQLVAFYENNSDKNKNAIVYTNRLSDLLFLISRKEDAK